MIAAAAAAAMCLSGCLGLGGKSQETPVDLGYGLIEYQPAVIPYAPPATPAFSTELATLEISDIADFKKLPKPIRLFIEESIELARKRLRYKFGADDPAEGGLDCSGFVHYALQQAGMLNIPRTSEELCQWVQNSGNFRRVRSKSATTPELDQLQPGDLLFWTQGSKVTHVEVYLGRRASDNRHLMAGATNRRDRNGGGAIYEFYVEGTYYGYVGPGVFYGYGPVPGLKEGRLNGGFSQWATTSN